MLHLTSQPPASAGRGAVKATKNIKARTLVVYHVARCAASVCVRPGRGRDGLARRESIRSSARGSEERAWDTAHLPRVRENAFPKRLPKRLRLSSPPTTGSPTTFPISAGSTLLGSGKSLPSARGVQLQWSCSSTNVRGPGATRDIIPSDPAQFRPECALVITGEVRDRLDGVRS
jgi:hypothetical protein